MSEGKVLADGATVELIRDLDLGGVTIHKGQQGVVQSMTARYVWVHFFHMFLNDTQAKVPPDALKLIHY